MLLCKDKTLVFNKSDKGPDLVVQNRTDYVRNSLEHLQDPDTYKELEGDPTNSICCGINKILSDFYKEGLLSKEMVDFCSPPNTARLARMYFLKKIHKSPMTDRPIVSSCESPTENISNFVDYWLQPIMKELPSYIKDTSQLIRELSEQPVTKDIILATVDVKSLYTSIPHEDGIIACRKALENSKTNNPQQPETTVLIKLLEIVLMNNTFEFDGKAYHQLQGCAMGSKLSPAYANIFMGRLEQRILSQAPLKPLFYRRYIDDCLILWPHPMPDLLEFLQSLNSFHPTIKFTSEVSTSKITFLDINIFKGPHFPTTLKLDVETHIKPTNHQLYVPANSYHPPGTGGSIAIGEMKRYLRTNSRADKFYDFKSKHKTNLRRRGYSLRFIKRHINKIKYSDRISELRPKNRDKKNKVLPFVTRYAPSAAKAMQIIKRYWPSITKLEQFKNFTLPTPLLAYKRNRNIKSFLVRAKLPSMDCNPLNPVKLPLNTSSEDPTSS